jgi:hypothetical protein
MFSLLMVLALPSLMNAQPFPDCDHCLDEPFIPVCVEDSLGETITLPNACFAECIGFNPNDFTACDTTIIGGGPCDDCLDEPFEPVCVLDPMGGYTIPFPNACFAECEGYTTADFVQCDSINIGGGPCDDCIDEPFIPVCVTDSMGYTLTFPNACFAECEGFTTADFTACDTTVIGGGGPCDDCWDEPFEPVCVLDSMGYTIPFPNACFAECEGYTTADFVQCDSINIGGGPCDDCIDEPFIPVCVTDSMGYTLTFPNACFAECEGFTSADFTVCDSINIGGWPCDDCYDEEFIPVCVEDSLGNIIPFPNACFAECEGYTAADFVQCDSIICDPPVLGGDCDECLNEPFDPVCVADSTGGTLLFPNACFAECVGFTSADFIQCDSLTGGGNNGSAIRVHDNPESIFGNSKKMELFKNPVNESARITYEVTTEEATSANIIVIDLSGRAVIQQSVRVATGANTYELNTGHLQPGIYQLNLQSATDVQTIKFVKQ